MSLNNWGCLAFDGSGVESQVMIGEGPGTSVEIYKNLVFVNDEASWHESVSFTRPTIAQIYSGYVEIAGFEIECARGPQESVFVFAERAGRYLVGIGYYGFDGGQWVGIRPETVDCFVRWMGSMEGFEAGFEAVKAALRRVTPWTG